jgi:hypothetical protein
MSRLTKQVQLWINRTISNDNGLRSVNDGAQGIDGAHKDSLYGHVQTIGFSSVALPSMCTSIVLKKAARGKQWRSQAGQVTTHAGSGLKYDSYMPGARTCTAVAVLGIHQLHAMHGRALLRVQLKRIICQEANQAGILKPWSYSHIHGQHQTHHVAP